MQDMFCDVGLTNHVFQQCFTPFPKQTFSFSPHLFCCLKMLSIWTSVKFWCFVDLTLYHTILTFNDLEKDTFFPSSGLSNSLPHNHDFVTLNKKHIEKLVGKGENAGNQYFLPFLQQLSLFEQYIFAPLAVGLRACVMARCLSCMHVSVRPCVNFFFKHLL